MVVATAATLCIGLTACSKDDKEEDIDKMYLLMYKWVIIWDDSGNYDLRYGLEFRKDGTYSYDTPNESAAGNYQIYEIQKSTRVISYSWMGNEIEEENDCTLYKMNMSGSSNFDQLWVYLINYGLVVHFYSNNELVQKPLLKKPV